MILYLILYKDDSFILDKTINRHLNSKAKIFVVQINKIKLGTLVYSNDWWMGNNWSKLSKR